MLRNQFLISAALLATTAVYGSQTPMVTRGANGAITTTVSVGSGSLSVTRTGNAVVNTTTVALSPDELSDIVTTTAVTKVVDT